MSPAGGQFPRIRRTLLASFAVIALALLVGGYAYARAGAAAIREAEHRKLAAIGDVKSDQIRQWRASELAAAAALAGMPGFAGALATLRRTPGSARARARVLDYLRLIATPASRTDALALDSNARIVASAGMDSAPAILPETRRVVAAALRDSESVMSEFFSDGLGGVRIDAAAAVRTASGVATGVVILRSEAVNAVGTAPAVAASGDEVFTYVVARAGDSARVLTGLPGPGDTAALEMIPLARTNVAVVQVVEGKRGIYESRTRRTGDIVADMRSIAGSPWFLVTWERADTQTAAIREQIGTVVIVVGLLILLAGAAVATDYRRRQAHAYRALFQSERDRHAAEELIRATLYSIGDGVITTDVDGRVQRMNAVAERLTAWTEAEARGRLLDDVFHIVAERSRAMLTSPVSRTLRDGHPVGLADHTMLVARDGTERPITDSAAPIRDEKNTVVGVVLVFSDRTEHRAAEHARLVAEERLRLALAAAGQGVFDLNVMTGETTFSPEYATMLGFDPAEFRETVTDWLDQIHPDDRDDVAAVVGDLLAGRRAEYRARYRIRNRAGAWRWMLSLGKLVEWDAGERPLRLVGTRTDITAQMENEARILRLSHLYAALSQCNKAIVHSRSEEAIYREICEAAVESGSARMAWIGLVDRASGRVNPVASFGEGTAYVAGIEISVNATEPIGLGPVGTCIRTDAPVWSQHWMADASLTPWRARGELFGWQSLAALPLRRNGTPVGALALYAHVADAFDQEARDLLTEMAHDIDFALDNLERARAKQQAEDALRESEARLKRSQQIARVGFLDWDLRTNDIYWSDEVVRMFGARPSANPQTIESTVALAHPDDRAFVRRQLDRAIQEAQPYDIEHRMVRPDGGVVWVHAQAELYRDDSGRPIRLLGTVIDITERKRAQMQLEMQSAALHAVADGIVITDPAGTILWVNPSFTAMTGYTAAEAVGRNPRDLLKATQQDPALYTAMWNTIVTGATWHGELTNRRKDGTPYLESMTITSVRDPSGAIANFVAVKQDITAQRQLELQFRQSQKMETVGRLAGGIAHDFNNLLAVINGTVELRAMHSSDDDPLAEDLRTIAEAGNRAAQLTRQLLAFSRQQVMRAEVADMNALVRDIQSMLRRMIGEDVHIELRLAEPLHLVRVDHAQFDQVLLNLVVNARDAMPHGGRLTIETANVELDEAYAADHPSANAGPHVMLAVTDTGVGMNREIQERIFEPFFTTKEMGRGTGLGLSTVYGIVKQSGGSIWVYSQTGLGTTFRIYLPRVDVVAPAPPAPASRSPSTGTETVLVVEDEPALLRLAERALRQAGYHVHTASNGNEAIARMQQAGTVALLLTDLILPGMNGQELAARLTAAHPGLRVIFTSGYAGDPAQKYAMAGVNFLAKPYSIADLTRKVRQVLDAAQA